MRKITIMGEVVGSKWRGGRKGRRSGSRSSGEVGFERKIGVEREREWVFPDREKGQGVLFKNLNIGYLKIDVVSVI